MVTRFFTVEISDIAQVFASASPARHASYIDIGKWGPGVSSLLLAALLLIFPPRFLSLKPSRIAKIVGAKSARNVNAGSRFVLRFNLFGRCGGLVPRVSSAGGLGFDHSTISGAITLRTMLVHVAKEGGLKASFCFGVYRFFDQFVPAIELLPALFHMGFH